MSQMEQMEQIMAPLLFGMVAYLITDDSLCAAGLTAAGTYLYFDYYKKSKGKCCKDGGVDGPHVGIDGQVIRTTYVPAYNTGME